jgi:hypothetical protein
LGAAQGFLNARRCYANLKQLREAVAIGLKSLNAISI